MTYDILIKEYRANMLENTHTGIICGVNDQQQTAFHIGDTEQYVFLRSAAKPIQAIPVFMTNIIEKYQLTEQESALFMASHRGESYQVDALESMLSKLPVKEEELYCAPSYPLNKSPQQQVIREGKEKRKLYHNCAGKHMGFITVCRELGYSVDEYWKPIILYNSKFYIYLPNYQIWQLIKLKLVLMVVEFRYLQFLLKIWPFVFSN